MHNIVTPDRTVRFRNRRGALLNWSLLSTFVQTDSESSVLDSDEKDQKVTKEKIDIWYRV